MWMEVVFKGFLLSLNFSNFLSELDLFEDLPNSHL